MRPSRIIILTAIVLLAALLRIYHVTQQSLWLDEGFTTHILNQANMFPAIKDNTHPPLYYLLLRGWTLVAGDSVLALRYFSVLPSLLAVAVTYQITLLLAGDRSATIRFGIGAAAMLLLALSDPEIFLAQEVRSYGWRTLLVCLNVWAYLRWLRQPHGKRALAWVITTVALPYTHYLAVYVPIVEGLHALIYLRGRLRWQAVGLLILSAALFMPWFLGVTLNQAATPPDYEMLNAPPSTLATLADLTAKYFSGQWALLLALAALGAVNLTTPKKSQYYGLFSGATFFLTIWLLLPVALTFLGNLRIPLLMPRNLSLITPAIAILVARGLFNVRQPVIRGALIAGIIVFGLAEVDYYRPKPPWNLVSANMARYATPGSAALLEVGNGGYPLGYYARHEMPTGTPVHFLKLWREAAGSAYDGELAAVLANHDTIWLAAWGDNHAIFDQLAAAAFTPTAIMTTDHDGNALNVQRYDRLATTQAPLTTFDAGMQLLAGNIDPTGQVDLWWTADEAPAQDYTVSVFVLDDALNSGGQLLAQHDAYPLDGARPTTGWTAGAVVYDPHRLPVADLPPGAYTVGVKVYTWQDGVVYPAADGAEFYPLGTLEVTGE